MKGMEKEVFMVTNPYSSIRTSVVQKTQRSDTYTGAQTGTGTKVLSITGGTKTSFGTGTVTSGAPRKQISGEERFIQTTGRNLQGEIINPAAAGLDAAAFEKSIYKPAAPLPGGATATSIYSRQNTESFNKAPTTLTKQEPTTAQPGLVFDKNYLIIGGIALAGLLLIAKR
jgi:hypothetical protein